MSNNKSKERLANRKPKPSPAGGKSGRGCAWLTGHVWSPMPRALILGHGIFVAVPPDRDERPLRVFETFTEDLHRMARWLKAVGSQPSRWNRRAFTGFHRTTFWKPTESSRA